MSTVHRSGWNRPIHGTLTIVDPPPDRVISSSAERRVRRGAMRHEFLDRFPDFMIGVVVGAGCMWFAISVAAPLIERITAGGGF